MNMTKEQSKKLMIGKNVMKQIVSKKPRIGGSCGLFLQGKALDFRDIDIIVNDINDIDLPYKKIPLIHTKRLNKTLKYNINNIEIDIIEGFDKDEKIIDYNGINVCLYESIINAKNKIINFLKNEYDERTSK